MYFALKTVFHKPARDLKSLPVATYWSIDLSMNFVTGFLILANWKGDTYDSILVIVDQLTKIVHYKPVKVTISRTGQVKVIINMVVHDYKVPKSIIRNSSLLFTSKFWFSLCYFLEIKKKLSTAFYLQRNG